MKFKVGDIVVVVNKHETDNQQLGEIYRIDRLEANWCYGNCVGDCQDVSALKHATAEEILAYSRGVKNINDIHKDESHKITDESILDQVKRKYPVGTIVKCASSGNTFVVYGYSDNRHDLIYGASYGSGGPLLYYEGKWADILEVKTEEIKKVIDLTGRWITNYDGKDPFKIIKYKSDGLAYYGDCESQCYDIHVSNVDCMDETKLIFKNGAKLMPIGWTPNLSDLIKKPIISLDDLKVGETYVFKYTHYTYINKIVNKHTHKCYSIHINSSNYVMMDNYGACGDISVALFSDREWLDKCIRSGKYMSKEEAMRIPRGSSVSYKAGFIDLGQYKTGSANFFGLGKKKSSDCLEFQDVCIMKNKKERKSKLVIIN